MEEDKLTEMIGEFEAKSIKEDLCVRKAADFVVDNAVEK
jgi:trigger factor